MLKNKFKGLVVFWVNLHPDTGQDPRTTLEMTREMNKPLFDLMQNEDGRYRFMFVPTFKESTRIEKIDFDEPFPRCMAKGVDVSKFGICNKKDPLCTPEQQNEFKGILVFFVNFNPEVNADIPETLKLIKETNKEICDEIEEDGRYKILIIPTVKEGSRIEKVDWDMPFPRIIPGGSDSCEEESEDPIMDENGE